MCGRTACTLCKNDLQRATQQYTLQKNCPRWIERYSWQNYAPNYNFSPGQVSPVLVMSSAVNSGKAKDEDADIVLFPMKWGLIPFWYKGDIKQYSLKTNNARIEDIANKQTYKKPLLSGQRCVILADGFYEWKSDGGKKQPYFIHLHEGCNSVFYDRAWEKSPSQNEEWNGPQLLTMAGIFDVWKSDEFGELFSYSVITMDSSETFSFLHHRMPAILDGKEQVAMWLDNKNVPYQKALSSIKAMQTLKFYPVSTEVNSTKNNGINCVKPIILSKPNVAGESTLKQTSVTSWFKRKPQSQDENESKKMKRE